DLHGNGYEVVLDVRGGGPRRDERLARCVVLDDASLAGTVDEAIDMVPGSPRPEAPGRRGRASAGRSSGPVASALRGAGLPSLRVPSPAGPLLPEAAAQLVDVRPAVYAFMRDGDPVSALELAVLKAPDLVDDLLKHAGPRFQCE